MSRRRRSAKSAMGSAAAAARAVGYVRVSTGKQAMSPAAQEEKIRALAGMHDGQLVEIVTDKESAKEGSIHTRPGIERILWLIDRGQVDRIIVAKLDRLTRSVVDLGELLTTLDRKGVSLASAMEAWMDTGSAVGRMIINIITCVAQWELEVIGERTAAVLQYKKAHGLAYNVAPYGFRAAGKPRDGKVTAGCKLVPVPAEQAVIARAKKLRKGGRTLQHIADTLNTEGIRTKGRRQAGQLLRGKWYASTIRNILLG